MIRTRIAAVLLLVWALASRTAMRPKVFIYDMPEKYHNLTFIGNQIKAPSCFYALDEIFPKLLRESPYVTANASEADYFYVSLSIRDRPVACPSMLPSGQHRHKCVM